MNIFSKLKHITDLTDNEKAIVHYIKEHTEDFIRLSAAQISQQCYVSTSSIYRLCQKVGVSGLSELKVLVSASIDSYLKEEEDFDYDYPIKQHQSQYQITHKLKEVYEQTLISSQNLLDLEQLRLVVNQMKKAKTIDLYTSAGNLYFAENFKFQMQEIGIQVNVPKEEYMQRLTASSSDDTHLAFIISFGGRGLLMNYFVQTLKAVKTPIVLISSTHENPLMCFADYQLFMSSYENHYNKISSFSTRLSLLYILDCLYTCFFELDYEHNVEKKLAYYQRMREFSK
ncbi:MurR/RpiR family transcriptional regulator [Beduini massiliensis]|uniref:MurR/RpiR family transcriptional regulator n=1 Tax=Beduini massiliensis TaxID=1585974 RepID=UPI00059A9FDC|nr:MurR/RpiR family transcriptional regulator [Beduini massiliensis]